MIYQFLHNKNIYIQTVELFDSDTGFGMSGLLSNNVAYVADIETSVKALIAGCPTAEDGNSEPLVQLCTVR